jgi:hypothetical protein
LISIEGQKGADHAAVNIDLGIGDHDDFKGAEYDQQDVEEGTLGVAVNGFFLGIFTRQMSDRIGIFALLSWINILPVCNEAFLHTDYI